VLFYADLGFFGFQVFSPTGPKALQFGQRYIWFIKVREIRKLTPTSKWQETVKQRLDGFIHI
jgi:hypothetical protein